MKIAIDIGPLTSGDKVRGVGFYTKNLITALQKIAGKHVIDAVDVTSVNLNKYDVIHYPYFKPYFSRIPKIDAKVVVTLHDATPLVYPKQYPPGIKGSRKLKKQINDLKHVDAIITDTEASKKDIVRFFKVPQEKITPTLLAPADHFRKIQGKNNIEKIREKYSLPAKFVLYVGGVNYNKNIPTLVKACGELNIPLVIVGKQAKEVDLYESDIKHLEGPRDWIRFLFGKPHPEVAHYKTLLDYFESSGVMRLGFVSDEDLVAIYNSATVYCQPSYYEGFGLPVLEAMATGTPVVIAKTQALVEIAGGAALIADPKNSDSMAKQIVKLLGSTKFRLKQIEKGHKNVSNYSWEKTAKETMAVYKSVTA